MSKRLLKKLRCFGQSTSEYAVLLAIVATALIGMQLYIRRGIQGRLRDLAFQLAPSRHQATLDARQYERNRTSTYTTNQNGITVETADTVSANVYQDELTIRSGSESTTIETQ